MPSVEPLSASPAPGLLEQVEALKLQRRDEQRTAFAEDSAALGAVINQLALQEADIAEEHTSKVELVAQATELLERLGLNGIAHAVRLNTRRVGGMY